MSAPTGTERRRVAVLGAGPIGLDAALAAVEQGWNVTVYEVGDRVADHVRAWGHVRLFTPWSMNVSPRMERVLSALGLPVPDGGEHPDGHELVERLLQPLADSPALAGRIRYGARVVAVGREGLLKHEEIGTPERAARPFRLLVEGADGAETVERADLVVDTTGVYGTPNALGDGGIPAPGERSVTSRIRRTVPDLATERAAWAGTTVLLVGAGKSAQTAARDLAALAASAPGTRVVWAVRAAAPTWGEVPDDALPQRQELVDVSRSLVRGETPGVEVLLGTRVAGMVDDDGRVAVRLEGADGADDHRVVDHVLALTGFTGDAAIYRQLQVHECYATSAPMNLSAALMAADGAGGDCLVQESHGVDVLRSPEPDFFVLGAKSYGRNSQFLLRSGYGQVDEVAAAYGAAGEAQTAQW